MWSEASPILPTEHGRPPLAVSPVTASSTFLYCPLAPPHCPSITRVATLSVLQRLTLLPAAPRCPSGCPPLSPRFSATSCVALRLHPRLHDPSALPHSNPRGPRLSLVRDTSGCSSPSRAPALHAPSPLPQEGGFLPRHFLPRGWKPGLHTAPWGREGEESQCPRGSAARSHGGSPARNAPSGDEAAGRRPAGAHTDASVAALPL